ncbi:MAG TPA: hypothetical protein VHE09_01615 [Rhizomicrobium sp.]|nr:hypothetical protein [Rhizomicrobium sp.]
MIFRAIFWIGLVALLMPHEPDLGFGRPDGMDTGVTSEVATSIKDSVAPSLKYPSNLCRYNAEACATTASLLDNVKAMTVRSLAQVKTDIEQSRLQRRSGS